MLTACVSYADCNAGLRLDAPKCRQHSFLLGVIMVSHVRSAPLVASAKTTWVRQTVRPQSTCFLTYQVTYWSQPPLDLFNRCSAAAKLCCGCNSCRQVAVYNAFGWHQPLSNQHSSACSTGMVLTVGKLCVAAA